MNAILRLIVHCVVSAVRCPTGGNHNATSAVAVDIITVKTRLPISMHKYPCSARIISDVIGSESGITCGRHLHSTSLVSSHLVSTKVALTCSVHVDAI